jgi:adenosylcobinamide kinase/adenosylcobinamide-phosphate guanylyltransferase
MTQRGKLVFVTGAARSGKSYWAEKLAANSEGQVSYIATCVPGDEEMLDRVARHQARRPAEWQTIEEANYPAGTVRDLDETGRVFLLDCLTLLLSNRLLASGEENSEESILNEVKELAQVSHDSLAQVIIVSNEVGWGIVPGDPLSREFRDIIGRANQIMAEWADEAYICIAGIPIELKALAMAKGNLKI